MINSIQVLGLPLISKHARGRLSSSKAAPAADDGSTLLDHVSTVSLGCMRVRRSTNQASELHPILARDTHATPRTVRDPDNIA